MKFPILAAALLAATPVLASNLTLETELGKTEAEVRASLVKLGYDVRKIEREDGTIEAYAVRDGRKAELYVDPTSGKIARIKSQ